MNIDRYTKGFLSIITVAFFIYFINITLSPLRVLAQADLNISDKIDDMNKRLESLEGTVGGGESPTPSIEAKSFTFQGISNLDQFCLEMQQISLTTPEFPKFTFPEMEITWPEIQKICGME